MCRNGAGSAGDETVWELSAADMAWWSGVFKTLGDPVRLRLVLRLAERPGTEAAVHELADVGVSLATVSHHLKRLRRIGLVESRRDGRLVYYRLADGVRAALTQSLSQRGQAGAPPSSEERRSSDAAPSCSGTPRRGGT
ncbi:ArsR family transcriptional regulator [Streptomyces sp. AJS327]|uniref:ArsR/SmtB family transcription factor n=1 Tax=Streptomyces sp. AJS327 TaxID=2545265 RepID=UPI0015DFB832|nr:metalloregulator ArsR/SmtB family transcription factor [Streptomyces sp. AJS327]MBA0050863.1 ArsR family transcriptional regulator [Streptomyces sp. AJS327]